MVRLVIFFGRLMGCLWVGCRSVSALARDAFHNSVDSMPPDQRSNPASKIIFYFIKKGVKVQFVMCQRALPEGTKDCSPKEGER